MRDRVDGLGKAIEAGWSGARPQRGGDTADESMEDEMERIIVELVRDSAAQSGFYRARDEGSGRVAESDHVRDLGEVDVHGRSALAAQAVTRLGDRAQSARA
jgi:hypothetical protein